MKVVMNTDEVKEVIISHLATKGFSVDPSSGVPVDDGGAELNEDFGGMSFELQPKE